MIRGPVCLPSFGVSPAVTALTVLDALERQIKADMPPRGALGWGVLTPNLSRLRGQIEQLQVDREQQQKRGDALYAVLAELIETLRREAPGTPLNNSRFDAIGRKANDALIAYRPVSFT